MQAELQALQAMAEAMGEEEARGMSGKWQGHVKWPVESRRWLTRAAEGSEGKGERESG